MVSTLITDYLGRGNLADRPTPPPVSTDCLAIYFATDVHTIAKWNGIAWEDMVGVDDLAGLDLSSLPIADPGSGQPWLNGGAVQVGAVTTIPSGDVIGNATGGTIVPTATTLTALFDTALGNVRGEVIFRSASAWTVLAPGTSGQFLQTLGAGANPQWVSGVTSVASRVGAITLSTGDLIDWTSATSVFALLASPSFTGDPKAPTASPGDNDTSISTTAFVTAAVGVETSRAAAAEALLAPLASPTLTGTPAAPTAAPGTNTTQLATTAYTTAAITAAAYVLPTASTSVLGGVKVDGTTVTISGGVISATGSGTVTSIALSGGTTGLSASGSPITTSGTITLGGTLAAANGGTGATALGSTSFTVSGGTLTARTAARLQAQWVSGAVVANDTFYFAYDSPYAGTINSLTHFTTTGSFSLAVQINGVSVTGLSAISPTSTPTTTNATALNTFTAGQRISGVITSAASSPTDTLLSLNVTWAN